MQMVAGALSLDNSRSREECIKKILYVQKEIKGKYAY